MFCVGLDQLPHIAAEEASKLYLDLLFHKPHRYIFTVCSNDVCIYRLYDVFGDICWGCLLVDFAKSLNPDHTGPGSVVSNKSDYRCVSDFKSWGGNIDPSPIPIDNEIISMVILPPPPPSADAIKKSCCQLQANVCAQSTG